VVRVFFFYAHRELIPPLTIDFVLLICVVVSSRTATPLRAAFRPPLPPPCIRISVAGLYVNYFCGGGDKEEDTGASPTNQDEGLEMQDGKTDNGDPDNESVKESPGSFKNIV
jgi:hypothetical protein